jgi:hypothetical protein
MNAKIVYLTYFFAKLVPASEIYVFPHLLYDKDVNTINILKYVSYYRERIERTNQLV